MVTIIFSKVFENVFEINYFYGWINFFNLFKTPLPGSATNIKNGHPNEIHNKCIKLIENKNN